MTTLVPGHTIRCHGQDESSVPCLLDKNMIGGWYCSAHNDICRRHAWLYPNNSFCGHCKWIKDWIEKCAAATGRWQTGETLAKIEQTISNLYPGPGAMLNHGEWLKITEPEMRELRRKSQDKEFSVFEDALRELSAPVPENQRQRRLRYPIKLYPDNVVDMGNHLMKDQIVTFRRLIESLGTEHAWRFEVIYRGYASLGHEIPWERQMATQGRFSIS